MRSTCFAVSLLLPGCCNSSSSKFQHSSYSSRPRRARTATPTCAAVSPDGGVNINKYKSQRAIVTTERSGLEPAEINSLLLRSGRPSRDEDKWRSAIQHSFLLVTARLISNRRLVGFARATSDRALNGTIWDVVTDPALPDELGMRRKVVIYLLKELRRTVPGCSIALFSSERDRKFYETLDFVADPDGIRGMAVYFDDTFEF